MRRKKWQNPNRCTSARPQTVVIYLILIGATEKAKYPKVRFLKICPTIGNAPFAALGKKCSGRLPGLDPPQDTNYIIFESEEESKLWT